MSFLLYLQPKIFLSAQSLLSCTVFVTSSSFSCPLSVIRQPPPFTPRLWGKPIYHRPKEGLHFVCFRDFPSISCSPNERGCRVPASPRRLKGAKSPVPSPVRGSNYPSRGPLRGALPSKQRNSHSGLSHIGPWPGHHHKKGPWTSMSYDPDRSWWFSGPWPG